MSLDKKQLSLLTHYAIDAARKAGQFISMRAKQPIIVERKAGGDSEASQVVTEVDREAQEIILKVLSPTLNQYDLGLLTEESEDDNSRFEKAYFWCIDPLDGTLPFIESTPGYAVSIALVSVEGVSQLGVIYDPVTQNLYSSIIDQGAFKNGLPLKIKSTAGKLNMFTDRSFLSHPQFELIKEECIQLSQKIGLEGFELTKYGGGAMNACWGLEKAPSCYFKFPKPSHGGGSLWDYAASACIATEAGAHVSDIHGHPLDLNRKDSSFMNHKGILYASDAGIAHHITDIYHKLS